MMLQRPLGRTGMTITPLGFGAFKIGRNEKTKYPSGYELPTEAETERLLNGVLDLGINHIDTAPAYGTSEERIGRLLSHRRGEFLLSTKVGETFENGASNYDFSADAVRSGVECSLRRLRTEVLDIVLIHSNGEDLRIQRETGAVPALQSLKSRGLVRAIGLSGKTPEGAIAALSWADVLMVEFHRNDVSHATAIAEAAGRGVGILIKKGLASGSLPPAAAIEFVLTTPGVSSLVVGGLSLDHLRENVAIATLSR